MSLVNLAHVCSHLQNASKARLGLTSIPLSKLHLALALNLQKQGFVSSVTAGGSSPPTPPQLQELHPLPRGLSPESLEKEPWRVFPLPKLETWKALGGSDSGFSQASKAVTAKHRSETRIPPNPAERRIWLGLKYYNQSPVLSKLKLESKPTKRIWLNSEDLGRIVRGREARYVKGMTRPGECLFVTTDRGIMEARECVERRIGGMVLCRVF